MNRTRISQTLSSQSGKIICNACSHSLVVAGNPWKSQASLSEISVMDMPGTGLGVQQQVVLRRFSCPACGSLLDTETAMPGDPFLDDVLKVADA